MMAREHETSSHSWGTFEELLLACAVNRHGTDSWESIVMEVQNKTSALSTLTSQHCRDKFNDLKRRFMPRNDTSASLLSMIDELRKIRVEELRCEVQRRDVSIVSLELKVKRLEEERERSVKEEADLKTKNKPSLDKIAGKSAVGDDSGDDRDNRSFNESNSTGQQQKAHAAMVTEQNDAVEDEPDIKPEPDNKIQETPIGAEPDPGWERYWSHNGTLEEVDDDDIDKIAEDKKKKGREIKMRLGESKREEKEKQNSDVQSSASLSLKTKNRLRRVGDGTASSSGEEPEGGDEVSPATKRMPSVKSEPLVKLLDIIRSDRFGSVFERRLRSQESERCSNLIRQHIDLETIQSRLDKGIYAACIHKFFRDLLLLFNNAIIFFRKSSAENLAACELRAIVLKEMKEKLQKPIKLKPKPKPKPKSKPEPELEPVDVKPETKQKTKPVSFSKSNKSCSTIVECGKGNSAKATSENAGKKVDKKDRVIEEKPKVVEKKTDSSFAKIKDQGVRKKRTKERSVSDNRKTNISNKNGEIKHQYGGNELSSHDALEMKVEKKGSSTRKRQGAASFLKRMKQNSPSEITEDDDDDHGDDNDSSEEEIKNAKVKEEKGRRGRNNRDGITERVTRSSRGRGAREESGRAKRGFGRGRPPKSTVESRGGTGKRGRDNGGSKVGVGGGGRAKKRSRR